MESSFNVYLSSNDPSGGYANSQASFRTILPETIFLKGEWNVSLDEFHAGRTQLEEDCLWVTSNLVDPSIVRGFLHPVLRVIPRKGFDYVVNPCAPVYCRVRQTELTCIHINITDGTGQLVTFHDSDKYTPSFCLLRFEKHTP